ncbi:MAG: PilW family protein [Lysobacteraceae bacterium]
MNSKRFSTGSASMIARSVYGFSLIELMVALVIGLLLMAAVSQVYLSNKTTFNTQDQTSQVMEAGNLAMGFIARDLRMAAFAGCASRLFEKGDIDFDTVEDPDANPGGDFASPFSVAVGGVAGAEADGTGVGATYSISATNPGNGGSFAPGFAGYTGVNTVPGSDVLKVSQLVEGRPVRFDPATNDGVFEVDGVDLYEADDVLVVADCAQATVFKVTGVVESGGKSKVSGLVDSAGALGKYKPVGVSVYRLGTFVYSVMRGADGTPSLVRAALNQGYPAGTGTPEELVGGVDSMQITYAESASDNASNYVTAADVVDWGNVRAVRIGLLLRTPDEIRPDSDTATYAVGGTNINPIDDRRQRQVFTTTVALRDRLK